MTVHSYETLEQAVTTRKWSSAMDHFASQDKERKKEIRSFSGFSKNSGRAEKQLRTLDTVCFGECARHAFGFLLFTKARSGGSRKHCGGFS